MDSTAKTHYSILYSYIRLFYKSRTCLVWFALISCTFKFWALSCSVPKKYHSGCLSRFLYQPGFNSQLWFIPELGVPNNLKGLSFVTFFGPWWWFSGVKNLWDTNKDRGVRYSKITTSVVKFNPLPRWSRFQEQRLHEEQRLRQEVRDFSRWRSWHFGQRAVQAYIGFYEGEALLRWRPGQEFIFMLSCKLERLRWKFSRRISLSLFLFFSLSLRICLEAMWFIWRTWDVCPCAWIGDKPTRTQSFSGITCLASHEKGQHCGRIRVWFAFLNIDNVRNLQKPVC